MSGNPAHDARADGGGRRVAMVSTHGFVAANPPLGAADTGGQVVYVLELSKKLAQLGYEVDIWTRQFHDQPALDVVGERVRVLRAPCGGPEFIPKEYLYESLDEWADNVLRRIAKSGFSYQFLNSHYWDAGLAGGYLCDALRIPHVHTPHSLGIWKRRQMLTDFQHDADKFERAYNFENRNRNERKIYESAELVVATTPMQVDMLRADYAVPPQKLRMIPPGYDDTRFYPLGQASRELLRKKFGFEGKVVLALGRIARNKGYDLLIRAFAEVAVRDSEARLYLAVGGEKLGEAEQRILEECRVVVQELGLERRVIFAGYVPDADLPDMYRAADVFVLSSRYEPFGMTAVEAMACGTPTVATVHGGMFRILRFGVDGLFADPFDAADLGITMLKPLTHPPLAERLSRQGAQTARSLFTWSGVAQQLVRAVEEHRPFESTEADVRLFGDRFAVVEQ